MIRKQRNGWVVLSSTGKKLGGPYGSREQAEKRLRQIEAFKHMRKPLKAGRI